MGCSLRNVIPTGALWFVGAIALGENDVGAMALGATDDEPRVYGSCSVVTTYDDFTDHAINIIHCEATGSDTGDHGVRVVHWSDPKLVPYAVFLKAGIQYQPDDTVDVIFRFDKGTVYRETWEWSHGTDDAIDRSEETALGFLENMEQAERLVYQVGEERSRVDLTDAAPAAADFRSRIASFAAAVDHGAMTLAATRARRDTGYEQTRYGWCRVDTFHRDRPTHRLYCESEGHAESGRHTGDHAVQLWHWSDPERNLPPYLVSLAVGIRYGGNLIRRGGNPIDVMYRFDEGAEVRDTWRWSGDTDDALDRSQETFFGFLDNLEQAERLDYRVGNWRAAVDLRDAAAAAADFRSRIAPYVEDAGTAR